MTRDKQLKVLECLSTHKYKIDAVNGVVYSSRRNKETGDKYIYQIKHANLLPNGYKQHLIFFKRGTYKPIVVYEHVLIYLSVYGVYPEHMVIDHIDNNPANNKIDNLQCITQEQNVNRKPRSRNGVKCSRITTKQIKQMIDLFNTDISSLKIAKQLNINRVTVQYYRKRFLNGDYIKYLEHSRY